MSGKATLPTLDEVKADIKLRKTFDGPASEYKPYECENDNQRF
jgi:2-oxoglutarate ferredoxin oxidoreductase subunit alpha